MLEIKSVTIDGRTFDDIEAGLRDLAHSVERAVDDAAPKVKAGLLKMLTKVAAELAERHGNPWRAGGSGSDLFSRTGGGLRGIANSIRVMGSGSEIVGSIAAANHMSIHETGGTITAKRSKYLTIPLPSALDSRGVPLKPKARDWDRTFVARSRKGSLLIFQRRGREIVPLYVLKSSVEIPARLGMGTTVAAHLPWFEQQAFESIVSSFSGRRAA